MQWLYDAHTELSDKRVPKLSLKYSGKFRGYNANVRYGPGWMEFSLARNWEDVDEEIKKGLVQHLLCRALRVKGTTSNIEMYEEFLRQVADYTPKGESDPLLEERFHILNEEYFDGMMEQPTLTWGTRSTTKLGSYEYGTDTVSISTVLEENLDMLDYVLYHELLHKKHKFTCFSGRTHHHTKAFKDDEAKFRLADAEARLKKYLSGKRGSRKRGRKEKDVRKGLLKWFFS